MITEGQIKGRIDTLEKELAELQSSHSSIVLERNAYEAAFQKKVVDSQNRFQQITGAIAQLRQLLNGKEPPV